MNIDEGSEWKGTPLDEIPTSFNKPQYPDVNASDNHTVLIKLPFVKGEIPQPYESKRKDVWSESYVRLPCSKHSLYPISLNETRERWEIIKEAYLSPILSSHQFETAVLSYNSNSSDSWNFSALHTFFNEVCEEEECDIFFTEMLPKIVKLALSLPQSVLSEIPLLKRHANHSITFSQLQVASLLANAFLCTFPRRNNTKRSSEYSNYPTINFNRLFQNTNTNRDCAIREKLKCIIHYFRRVTSDNPTGLITYSRYYIPDSKLPEWKSSKKPFKQIHISTSGTIEDNGVGLFQMDFAHKLIGGGVIANGTVQEEIRFVICPELILTRLFTEVLDDTEVLVVTGCERFSKYEGYGTSFTWTGNFVDTTPSDEYGRKCCTVVAVDALAFGRRPKAQFLIDKIRRELNKVYTGFSWGSHYSFGELCGVATGNWGCGVYRGNLRLKALLQLMAASQAHRPLVYFTFGNDKLRDDVHNLYRFLQDNTVVVGIAWELLYEYSSKELYNDNVDLYDFMYRSLLSRNMQKQVEQPSTSYFGSKSSSLTNNNVVRRKFEFSKKKVNNAATPSSDTLSNDQISKMLLEEDEDLLKNLFEDDDLEAKSDHMDVSIKRMKMERVNCNDMKAGKSTYKSNIKNSPDKRKDGNKQSTINSVIQNLTSTLETNGIDERISNITCTEEDKGKQIVQDTVVQTLSPTFHTSDIANQKTNICTDRSDQTGQLKVSNNNNCISSADGNGKKRLSSISSSASSNKCRKLVLKRKITDYFRGNN